jgi:hypothetical protein
VNLKFLENSGHPVPVIRLLYLIIKTNQMHQSLKYILFGMKLYIFQTFLPSIIRSSKLYIQHKEFVRQILLTAW